jgi:hypothetical protein
MKRHTYRAMASVGILSLLGTVRILVLRKNS